MLLLKTAFKNIIGAGKRTWLNVAVLSFTLVLTVLFNGMMDGWLSDAKRNTVLWEVAAGQFWHPEYDRHDIFTLQNSHGPIPPTLLEETKQGLTEPVLVIQGSLYPQGRMLNVLIKGINPEQSVLALPLNDLPQSDGELQAVIGNRMAEAAGLRIGDQAMLRWRDKNDSFDARNVTIVGMFNTDVGSVDSGQIWVPLEQLYEMTGLHGEATYLVSSGAQTGPADGWPFHSAADLMQDLDAMEKATKIEASIIFVILMAIAMLAVFDTQTLSVFRRQKEIGTYVALGMTPKRVSLLFTLEGALYSLLAILAGAVWGAPVLYLVRTLGIALPESYSNMGVTISNVIRPAYFPSTVLTIIVLVIGLSALVSWLPARKITRQNMVQALKGKAI